MWRPSDWQQREGRLLRQGNIFPEVHICTYVTENSFDGYMWQTVESKARFISQIMAGEVTARTAEDVDQLVMTAAQIKAIASGNPQILEKVATEVELVKIERLYSAWVASRQRLRRQMESMPAQLDSVAREIAGHRKAISTRDRNEHDDFKIELRRDFSSEEAITFTDRGRAGTHLRQLCFATARESQSRGYLTKVLGCYHGFEIIARASDRKLDAFSSLFSETSLFLCAGEGEMGYGVKLGESDIGILQSMYAQLRGLEGKLEKSLAAQAGLEHRQAQINTELNKVFEHAARYEELRLRLSVLNQELTKTGMETEPSLELSNLDEEAFRAVNPGISVRQIFSLTGQSVETSEEKAIVLKEIPPITLEAPVVASECLIAVAADLPLTQSECETAQINTRADAESKSKYGVFAVHERDHDHEQLQSRGAASQSITTREASQQMCFDWS